MLLRESRPDDVPNEPRRERAPVIIRRPRRVQGVARRLGAEEGARLRQLPPPLGPTLFERQRKDEMMLQGCQ